MSDKGFCLKILGIFTLEILAIAGLFLFVRDHPTSLFLLVPVVVLCAGLFTSAIKDLRREVRKWQDSFWRLARCPACGQVYGPMEVVFPPPPKEEMVMGAPDLGVDEVRCPSCHTWAKYGRDTPYVLELWPTPE